MKAINTLPNKALRPTAYSLRFASFLGFATLPAAGELGRCAGARSLHTRARLSEPILVKLYPQEGKHESRRRYIRYHRSHSQRTRKGFFGHANSGADLFAPRSLYWEIGNAFSAMLKRQRVTVEQAKVAIEIYRQIPLNLTDVELIQAIQLAA